MKNKDWDSYLQGILGDFEPKGDSHWEDLNSKLDGDPMDVDDFTNPDDEALKNSLTDYKPTGEVQGWDKLANSLDKADSEFDTEVADKIKHYNAPYDPNGWSLFLKHFSAYKALRLKLIALKMFEASAVLLLLFTVFQMHQKGSFSIFGKQKNIETNFNSNEISSDHHLAEDILSSPTNKDAGHQTHNNHLAQASSINNSSTYLEVSKSSAEHRIPDTGSGFAPPVKVASTPSLPIHLVRFSSATDVDRATTLSGIAKISNATILEPSEILQEHITESLALTNINLENQSASLIPYPVFVKQAVKGHLEFGMLAQVDFNTMKMPQDILYTNRKQFVFPLQSIPSVGYGAGFTLGVAHERWAFESGVIYNSKTFKPGRRLTIGEESDQSNVEFDAMQIQLISVPIQFRFNITPQSRFNMYAIAGLGMHIIAQSDIDVDINYDFNSLPEGENPNNHPALAQTIRESQRLSDKIRHKAPFSTKSYVTANIGLGFEYAVAARKTLFLQTIYQYQIPNLRFSNHNGKHLVSTSIQAGVRTPLGF